MTYLGVKMKKLSTLFLFIIITFSMAKKSPDWVTTRPTSPFQYTGIGVVNKSKYESKDQYINAAKMKALNDISSTISVSISSKSKVTSSEVNNKVSESFNEDVSAITSANLEGYDFVGSWENKDEYWVYYRLDKHKWEEIQQKRVSEKVNSAMGFMKNGDKFATNGNVVSAVNAYANAFNAIVPILYLSPTVPFDKSTPIISVLDNKLVTLLNKLEYDAKNPLFEGIRSEIKGKQFSIVLNMGNIAVPSFPLFIGKFADFTDKNGKIYVTNKHINSEAPSSEVLIEVKCDVDKILNNGDYLELTKNWLAQQNWPSTTLRFVFKKPTVFIEVLEEGYDDLPYNKLSSEAKERLVQAGYDVARFPEDADMRLVIKATTRPAGSMGNLYFSYLDINWTLYGKSGDEVASKSLKPVKGGALSYDDASVKAFLKGASLLGDNITEAIKNKK
jgi:hypothetical protein